MSFRQRFVRFLEPLAIPHVALYLVLGQLAVLLAEMSGRISAEPLLLVPARVLEGEWWRLVTFLLQPPPVSWMFVAFAWWLFYFMGSALEGQWGVLRFNLFLLTGWALTVAVAFVTPSVPASNSFVAGSVFLAFAWLVPEFELAIFFVLPVKIKWLALLTWCGYAMAFITGGWATRLAVLAATGNFLLFFGRDLWLTVRFHKRRMSREVDRMTEKPEPRHRCVVCGKDSDTHRELDFRYCSKCVGAHCYCPEHIGKHEHVLVEEPQVK